MSFRRRLGFSLRESLTAGLVILAVVLAAMPGVAGVPAVQKRGMIHPGGDASSKLASGSHDDMVRLGAQFGIHDAIGSPVSIGEVRQTLNLANGSTSAGDVLPITCHGFQDVTVADSLQRAFVACLLSSTVIGYDLASGTIVGAVQVGASPTSLVFDPANNRVYVAESQGVAEISAVNLSILASVPVGGSPYAITLDNETQSLYISDANDNVTVLAAINDSVIATVPLGQGFGPLGIAYDESNHYVYVVGGAASGQADVISPQNYSIVHKISLPAQPFAVAADSATGKVYVTTFNGEVVAISGSNQSITGTIETPGTEVAAAVDPLRSLLFLASTNVTVVNTTTLTIVRNISVGSGPSGIDIDAGKARVCVADLSSSDLAEINESTLNVVGYLRADPGPVGLAWNPVSNEVDVANQASGTMVRVSPQTDSIVRTTNISYGLTGLAVDNTTGNVFVGNIGNNRIYDLSSTGTLLTSSETGATPEGVAYDSQNGDIYVANYAANTVSVVSASTGSNIVNISIPPFGGIGGGLVDVAFNPSNGYIYTTVNGCICSTPGNVTVIDGHTNKIVGTIPAWAEPGPAADIIDSQNNELYVTDDFGNWLVAFNATTYRLLTVTPVGTAPEGIALDAQTGYIYVSNSKSGNVSVIDTSSNHVVGALQVGDHPYGVTYDPNNGLVYVANQYSGTVSIISPPTYLAIFNETGLPSGTNWTVTVGGISNSSRGSSMAFAEADGSYNYTVTSGNTSYRAHGGSFTIQRGPTIVTLVFSEVRFAVGFEEAGLRTATNWSLDLGGSVRYSTNSIVVFSVPNGSYWFAVNAPSGYAVTPSNGSLKIEGVNQTVNVTFKVIPKSSWSLLGLNTAEWGVILVIGVLVASVAMFIFFRRRKSEMMPLETLSVEGPPSGEDRPP